MWDSADGVAVPTKNSSSLRSSSVQASTPELPYGFTLGLDLATHRSLILESHFFFLFL